MVIYPIEGRHVTSSVDVSVIIPVYKSKNVLIEQILRWTQDDGISVEIIYVHNKCPQNSVEIIIDEWNRRVDKNNFNVKILMMNKNVGFGGACNIGAYHAKGEHLIFLNADTTSTPNWIKPMIELFDDPSVGIVGNLQLKEGELHGSIDGAGSEWFWEEENFVHIGRHCLDGKHIKSPLHYNEIPFGLRTVAEREMVTGCCFAIPRKLFQEVGGFDEKYRLGYWEDSELCMTIREMGYKILFQPRSIIFHKLAQSGAQYSPQLLSNKNLFMGKWVDSGRLDKLVTQERPLPLPQITNILVRRQGAHGDVLLAAAVVPALKKRYPDARIYFETKCPTVLHGHPDVDYIINEPPSGTPFQLIINLDYAYERRPFTSIIKSYADEAGVSVEDCELVVARGSVHKPELNNYVVIHAGTTAWVGRNWIRARWDEIAVRLHNSGHQVICVGRGDDHKVPCDADCRNMTSVQELATLIADAKLFIGIDSMPFQIAQATHTPIVCFFGSIEPKLRVINDNVRAVTAKDVGCLGCHHRQPAPSFALSICPTGTLDCENKLSVDDFWAEVEAALQEVESK
jgi:GT2 family glycosyltransferase/ADP-heptose:LPS heptosyltransferase